MYNHDVFLSGAPKMRLRLISTVCALLLTTSYLAAAQSRESVLYSFAGGVNDGSSPNGGLVFDNEGNLYGTTMFGGIAGCMRQCGTAFELTPTSNGTWTETILYKFCSQPNCADGGEPRAGLIIDNSGNLYGTAAQGGVGCGGVGCGTVFELSPPQQPGGSWTETVLWSFGSMPNDGVGPYGSLSWGASGNLYGTTAGSCCSNGFGTVFELSPGLAGNWSESVLYTFCLEGYPCSDGYQPEAGIAFDKSGNIYGTTVAGAFDGKWGTVYKLSPQRGGTWSEATLYRFSPLSGGNSSSQVSFDRAGNLYGSVSAGGNGCGGVWRMQQRQQNEVREVSSLFAQTGAKGCAPLASVLIDSQGTALYAVASTGGAFDRGTLFEVTSTKQTVLYNFCQQDSWC
jgi:hypothetical protein